MLLALEDDFLGLLGQILAAVHLLKLLEFFLGVFQVMGGVFSHVLRPFHAQGLVDFQEFLEVFVGLLFAFPSQSQVQRHGLFEDGQFFLGLLQTQFSQLVIGLHILDCLIDFLQIEFHEHVPLLDRRTVFNCLLDGQTQGPRLRLDEYFLHLLGFEDAFYGRLQFDDPLFDLVRSWLGRGFGWSRCRSSDDRSRRFGGSFAIRRGIAAYEGGGQEGPEQQVRITAEHRRVLLRMGDSYGQ